MKIPLAKRPDAPTPPDVEQMLRASAAWEPDASPPSDFASFTRKALERGRKPWTVGLARSPLVLGLASVCVLWMGNVLRVPHQPALNAAAPPRSCASGAVPAPASAAWAAVPSAVPPLSLVSAAAGEPLPEAAPRPHAPRSAGHRRTRRPSPARRLWDTEASEDRPGTIAAVPTAAVWKTETVERPAWGALVPVPTAAECAVPDPASAEGTEGSEPSDGEATAAILPVLDVALPDPETPMPAPSAAPIPSPEK